MGLIINYYSNLSLWGKHNTPSMSCTKKEGIWKSLQLTKKKSVQDWPHLTWWVEKILLFYKIFFHFTTEIEGNVVRICQSMIAITKFRPKINISIQAIWLDKSKTNGQTFESCDSNHTSSFPRVSSDPRFFHRLSFGTPQMKEKRERSKRSRTLVCIAPIPLLTTTAVASACHCICAQKLKSWERERERAGVNFWMHIPTWKHEKKREEKKEQRRKKKIRER